MDSLPTQLKELLTTLNTTSLSVNPHHIGQGTHITIQFHNGQEASITTNTCHSDADNTYEIMATATHPNHQPDEGGTLCHIELEDLLTILRYISLIH